MLGRQAIAKPQGDGAVADRAGKADPVWRIGREIDRVAWRARDLPARRFVLGEQAAERQHDGIEALPLDLAAGVRARPRLEQTDLQRLALEQGLASGLHGDVPVLLFAVLVKAPPGLAAEIAGVDHLLQ
jgi:hypothetical protein